MDEKEYLELLHLRALEIQLEKNLVYERDIDNRYRIQLQKNFLTRLSIELLSKNARLFNVALNIKKLFSK